MALFWLTILTIGIAFVYYFIVKKWNYFEKNGVKSIQGIPLFGATYKMTFGLESTPATIHRFYQKYKNLRFFGIFDTITPIYFLCDPELIKQVAVKDFDHFTNHVIFFDEGTDPMLERNLFFMRDQRWKDMRATLSPAFTGSKMRLMFQFIEESSQEFVRHLLMEANSVQSEINGRNLTTGVYEMKDLFTRYTSDTIATCAFGLKVNSLDDKENDFYKTGCSMTTFSTWTGIKFVLLNNLPALLKLFNLKLLKTKDVNYFRSVIQETIKYREQNNVIRPDMIHLLMAAKSGKLLHENEMDDGDRTTVKDDDIGFSTAQESMVTKTSGKLQKWNDDDVLAQCIIFFFAGFDTVSTLTCFIAHELALNQNIQDKLYNEIVTVAGQLQNEPMSYETIQKMKYLDMIVSEGLRKWPPATVLDRHVTKPYVMETYDGNKVKLNIGDAIWIPTYALHMDDKYFPNPKQFDPERFSDTNKNDIHAGVYTPFGVGPRNCIGSRFALMECKSLLYHLILNFKLEKCERTQDPLKLKCVPFAMGAENGFYLKLTKR